MRIKYSDIFLNVNKPADFKNDLINIFFLHGFTGSSEDWNFVLPGIDRRFNKFTIDLIGHGKSDSPNDKSLYSWELQVEQINKIISHFTEDKVIVAGYSMGGRLALSYAQTYPERILGLILESTSPGIKEKQKRENRIKEDEKLAEFILSHSIEEFINMWVDKDIFTTQLRFSEERRNEIKKAKMQNNRIGLSNSLKEFSTGKMPYFYEWFKNFNVSTLLLTGQLDTKFTSLNTSIVNKFPAAEHKIIKNAGHNVHLEEPEKYLTAVNNFLGKF